VEIIRRLNSYASEVPIEDVAAHEVGVGDVVRLDEPQAHRVERVVRVDARVVLELRPVGLEISETVRVTLPEDGLVVASAPPRIEPGEGSRVRAPVDL
jgi:hypothetical protein